MQTYYSPNLSWIGDRDAQALRDNAMAACMALCCVSDGLRYFISGRTSTLRFGYLNARQGAERPDDQRDELGLPMHFGLLKR
jgi:hypothetical protein